MHDAAAPRSRRAHLKSLFAQLADLIDRDEPSTPASKWMCLGDSPVEGEAKKWISEGVLPTCRPGKLRLVDRAVHDRLCEERTKKKQAPPGAAPESGEQELDQAILRRAAR